MATVLAHSRRHHTAAAAAARVPDPYAHLHPDWRPPAGWHAPASDDRDPPARAVGTHTRAPAACPSTTTLSQGDYPGNSIAVPASLSSAPAAVAPLAPGAVAGAALPPPAGEDEHEDDDARFRDPYLDGSDPERRLSYTALPLRHRIYALHCQGRSLSAIARTLRLDRGTVARHLHAVEALLLAEQTADLARLRLRAVEAQHAILAAAWDALLFEEEQEHSYERERADDRGTYARPIPQPARSRRAHLLATAARAARTAAQLQGLFTPAALQAALQTAQRDPLPAGPPVPTSLSAEPMDRPPTTLPALRDYPRNSIAGSPAATTPPAPTELPAGLQPADRPPTTPPAASVAAHGCAPSASPSVSPRRAGEGPGERSAAFCGMPASTPTPPAASVAAHGCAPTASPSASPLRRGEGPGERSAPRVILSPGISTPAPGKTRHDADTSGTPAASRGSPTAQAG